MTLIQNKQTACVHAFGFSEGAEFDTPADTTWQASLFRQLYWDKAVDHTKRSTSSAVVDHPGAVPILPYVFGLLFLSHVTTDRQ